MTLTELCTMLQTDDIPAVALMCRQAGYWPSMRDLAANWEEWIEAGIAFEVERAARIGVAFHRGPAVVLAEIDGGELAYQAQAQATAREVAAARRSGGA